MGGVKRRAQQLLIPFFVWSIISFLISSIGSNEFALEKLVAIVIDPDGFFWFLWALFWIYILFTLAQTLSNMIRINEMITIFTLCILLITVMIVFNPRILGFQFISYYFLFYVLGYCVHKYHFLQVNNNIMLIVLAVAWAVLAWFWKMHSLPEWVPIISHIPSSAEQYAYRGITAAIAIIVLLGMSPKILNSNSACNTKMSELGIVSLGLYVVHLTLLGYVVKGLRLVCPSLSIPVQEIIVFVICCILSVIIVKLLGKNKYTSLFLLGKLDKKEK